MRILPILGLLVTSIAPLQAEDWTLQQVERDALAHNRGLAVMHQRERQEQHRHAQARARWLPAVGFSADAVESELGSNRGRETRYSSRFGVSQTLFSPDVYHGYRQSSIERDLLRSQLVGARNDVLLQARLAYYGVILARGQVEIELENSELLEEALVREQRRLEYGASTEFDVHQSEVVLANALARKYEAEKNLQIARHDLLLLLGRDPEVSFALAEREIQLDQVPELQAKVEQLEQSDTPLFSAGEKARWERGALLHRPEMEQAALGKRRAERQEKSAWGSYLPSVHVGANYTNSSPSRFTFLDRNSYWDVGVHLNWNLFDGLARESRVREARAGVVAARIQEEEVEKRTKVAVSNGFIEIEEALRSFGAARRGEKLAHAALAQAKSRREAGVITALEYRDVMRSLAEARHRLNLARFQILRSYYLLRHVSGADIEGGAL